MKDNLNWTCLIKTLTINKIDYISNKEYHNDTINFTHHANGRIIKVNTTYEFEYTIKDHLGNTRVTFSDSDNDGTISSTEVKSSNDYYAYGMEHVTNGTIAGPSLTTNKYTYNGKEKIDEMGWQNILYGARTIDPVLGIWQGIDSRAIEMPRHSPYAYCFGNPIILIDPDGNRPTPREAALIAAHVYAGSNVNLEGGWIQSTRNFGIEDGSLDNGMRSLVYERTINNKTEFVYAFQGSDFENYLNDWTNNGKQMVGESDQYTEAIKNARTIDNAFENNDAYELTFVGHSLGGGLAAASAYATGREAITFNAAGVSQKTLDKNGVQLKKGDLMDKILAFIMASDPLNGLQNNTKSALGLIMPDGDGTRYYLSPTSVDSKINGHSMVNVLKEIFKLYQCEIECP